MRARHVSMVILVALLAAPTSASAGGWATGSGVPRDLETESSLTFTAGEVWFFTVEEAQDAFDEAYFAYLVEDYDHRRLDRALRVAEPRWDWWQPVGERYRIGTVELIDTGSNVLRASVDLFVPAVEPGSYHFMLCDATCDRSLANIIPTRVFVADDVATAGAIRELAGRSSRLERRSDELRAELRRVRQELARVDVRAESSGAALLTLRRRVEALEDVPPEAPPWSAFAGWFFGGLATGLLAGLLYRLRRRDPLAHVKVPDDPRELAEFDRTG